MKAKRIPAFLASIGLAACGWFGDEPDQSRATQLLKTEYGDSAAYAFGLSVAPLPHERGFVAAWEAHNTSSRRIDLEIVETDSLGRQISAWKAMSGDSTSYHEPRVAGLLGGGYVVAWLSRASAIQGYAHFQIVGDGHGTGNTVPLDFPGVDDVKSISVAAMRDSGFVLAVSGNDSANGLSIFVQRYNPAGIPSGPQGRIFKGRETGKPEILALEGGGWMLAWKTVDLDSAGIIMGWQPFSGNGEPAGEARKALSGDWDADLRMRSLPGGRIHLEEYGTERGMFLDAQGMPDPKYASFPRYLRSLAADSSRGRLYGMDIEEIYAFDSEARPRGSRRIPTPDGLFYGKLFITSQGNLVLFAQNPKSGPYGESRAVIQSLVMKPF